MEYLLPNGGQYGIPVAKWWTVYNIICQMVDSVEYLLPNGG
jgi:hypothetical protein